MMRRGVRNGDGDAKECEVAKSELGWSSNVYPCVQPCDWVAREIGY